MSRSWIALQFYQSLESRQTRVTGLYQALLDRDPDSTGLRNWSASLGDGQDVRLAAALAASPEYSVRSRSSASADRPADSSSAVGRSAPPVARSVTAAPGVEPPPPRSE